jgi:hypothetical protein
VPEQLSTSDVDVLVTYVRYTVDVGLQTRLKSKARRFPRRPIGYMRVSDLEEATCC